MGRRRPDLRELRALLRAPETGSHNLAAYIAVHGAELGLDPSEVAGPDEIVAPRLLAHLEAQRAEGRRAAQDGISATLRQLQSEARWCGEQIVLPAVPLFRLASTANGRKYVRLVGDGVDVTIVRQLLQRAGVALRAFRNVSVCADGDGVHLGWGARGRLNFYSQRLTKPVDALVVSLPRRAVSRRLPALLGEILVEIGLGI